MLPGKQYTVDSVLRLLWAKRWLIVVPLFLGVLGGLLYSRFQPDLYRSDALVQVVPQRVPDEYVRSTVTDRVEDRLRALAQQVLSRTQLERLVLDFDLYPDIRAKRPMEDVVALMAKRVIIEPVRTVTAGRDGGADAFRISFDHADPRVAQKVVERLASYFIDTNARERGSQADQTSQFLEAQLTDARTRLEAQEKKLEHFREANAGRLPTQMQANMQAIQNTQMALQAMVESMARDRDRKAMLERLYSDAAADAPSSPAAASVSPGGDASSRLQPGASPQEQLEAARALLAQLELRLTPKHPDVTRTRRLIADLERQVAAAEAGRPLSGDPAPGTASTPEQVRHRERLREMRAEIESLDRQIAFKEGEERRLRAQVGTYQARLEAVPGIESEWIALTRDYDTLQATYKELLAKSENSKMAASLEQRQIGEQFRLLDAPHVPERPFSPNRIRINALGTMAGLGLGVLLLGLTEFRDATMRTEAEVVGALDLPVLVVVPYVASAADHLRQKRRRLMTSVAVAVVCVATGALAWFLQLWKFVV
jgi:polysaccharide chain length determinant protein (PEP-CTERM system associated)